jgi:hypothetical protein
VSASYRFDQRIERHEGPFTWEDKLKYYDLEFIDVDGKAVLLPLDRKHHPNLTVLRTIESADGKSLVLFLQDTTYLSDYGLLDTGFLAVCDKVAGEEFYIAIVYHEWYLLEEHINAALVQK